MCRMLAAYIPERFGYDNIVKFLSEMAKNGFRGSHEDGCGALLLTPLKKPIVYKTLSPAHTHVNEFIQLIKASNPIFIIMHARKGSRGPNTIENVHPFVSNRAYLFHNGTLHERAIEYAKKELKVKNRMSSTDSELLLHIYNEYGENTLVEFLLLHQTFMKDFSGRKMGSNIFIFDEKSNLFVIYHNVLKDEFFHENETAIEDRRYFDLFSYKLDESWIVSSESPKINTKLNVNSTIKDSEIPFERFIDNHYVKSYKKGSLEVKVIKIEL